MKNEKQRNKFAILMYVTSLLVKVAIYTVCALVIFMMVFSIGTVYLASMNEPSTYTVEVTDKSLTASQSRFSVNYKPTLHFTLPTGEDESIVVNGESYDNINVGDYIAVDVYRVGDMIGMIQLNTELNNIKEE